MKEYSFLQQQGKWKESGERKKGTSDHIQACKDKRRRKYQEVTVENEQEERG